MEEGICRTPEETTQTAQTVGVEVRCGTEEVGGVLAVAEPPGGLVAGEVDAVVREVGLQKGQSQVVVVADVGEGVAEDIHRRDRGLSLTAATVPVAKKHGDGHQCRGTGGSHTL
ncbi:hypothetical protein GW17_00004597 [Ensete ventricosum]|nr:hypothetical protein GW17_00004597 [Ensete ventricosum]